jgi:hypothetical protein
VRRICRALEGQVAIAVVGFSAEPAVLRDPASVCQFLVGLADVISALAGGREAAWSLPESPCEFRLTTRGEWLWARVMPGSEGACRSAMFGKRDFEPRPTYGGG